MQLSHFKILLWIAVIGMSPVESAAENNGIGSHLMNPSGRGIGGQNNGFGNNGFGNNGFGNNGFGGQSQFQSAQGGGFGASGGGGGGGGGASYRGVSEAAKESIKSGEKAREEIKSGVEKSNETIKSLTEGFFSGIENLAVPEATEAVEAVAAAQPAPQPTNIGADIVNDIVAATQKISETRVRIVQEMGKMFTAPPSQAAAAPEEGGTATTDRIAQAGANASNRGRGPASLGTTLDHRNRGIGVGGPRKGSLLNDEPTGSYNTPSGVKIPQTLR